ncbi:DUF664 domain-containing protein [Luteipulveratus sp. YIM 133132]|uniref:mycothiol transferase n=1 Tax=Luteipulveratus flavus TaxID=3031728 RepID=UPI0023AFE148|nr:DUF664 domain-containing protein [Luteipulveratus sp. YIM 133132]MDE9364723.1 DUF664 domain-containing protein [Luteipulveratus sp. YIM 133132]
MTERADLAHFLDAQRRSVVAIVDGLDAAAMTRSVVPSGWSPQSLLEHLAGAERYWFGAVMRGEPMARPDSGDVLADYLAQTRLCDEAVRDVSLDSAPAGPVLPELADEVTDLRGVILHMIEETARHAGHLDIARELLDGRTGLGPR